MVIPSIDKQRFKFKTLTKQLFSDQKINIGRQSELDIAKTIIIFFLAFIHCIIECTPEENLVSGIPYLFDTIIGGPLAAPMFMFSMGVGMIYSKNASADIYIKRGIKIFITGFVLNICRYTIPFLMGYAITADYAKYVEPLVYRTLCNDMLQFAGMAMMLIGFMKKMKMKDYTLLAVGLVMSFGSMYFIGLDVGNPIGNILLGFLVGTEDAAGMVFSDFPLFNWFIVPAAGYVFGTYLIRLKDKDRFYRTVSPVCLAIVILYFYIGIKNETGMFGEGENCYYHIITSDVLISIVAEFGLLGVYYFISEKIPSTVMKWIREISKNVTDIYCIHWVLVTMTINVCIYIIRGTQILPVEITLILAFVISIMAIIIAHLWSDCRKGR